MFSLNVPAPGRVRRLAADLSPALSAFDSVRERHALVVKRLGDGPYDPLESEVRRVLAGAPAFEARVTGIEAFRDPVSGPGPVVYLAVESPGLYDLHDRLVEAFGAVEGLEGDDYTPHVTLARGGPADAVERLLAREVEPIEWTVSGLAFWDARRGERVAVLSLPA